MACLVQTAAAEVGILAGRAGESPHANQSVALWFVYSVLQVDSK